MNLHKQKSGLILVIKPIKYILIHFTNFLFVLNTVLCIVREHLRSGLYPELSCHKTYNNARACAEAILAVIQVRFFIYRFSQFRSRVYSVCEHIDISALISDTEYVHFRVSRAV